MSLELRPVRPADRDGVLELTADVWGGDDYIAGVFDLWVGDPGAWFQAAEIDGVLAGLQRLRPLSREIVWYEGLRVGSRFRRQGIARRMLTAAVAQARGMGFQELRLATGNPDAAALFTSAGFDVRLLADLGAAAAMEGDEPPAMAGPDEAARLFRVISADPAFAAYNGLLVDGELIRDLDASELTRQADLGRVRVGAGGRALAIVRPWADESFLWAGFVSGSGAALRDLMLALRSEADLDRRRQVRVFLPPGHPGQGDLEETGYDFRTRPFRMTYFALRLQN